jgi:hypothetical protein
LGDSATEGAARQPGRWAVLGRASAEVFEHRGGAIDFASDEFGVGTMRGVEIWSLKQTDGPLGRLRDVSCDYDILEGARTSPSLR